MDELGHEVGRERSIGPEADGALPRLVAGESRVRVERGPAREEGAPVPGRDVTFEELGAPERTPAPSSNAAFWTGTSRWGEPLTYIDGD